MIEGREQNPLLKLVRSHSKRSAKHEDNSFQFLSNRRLAAVRRLVAVEGFATLCRNTSPLTGTGKGIEIAKPIIEALKRKGASAMGVVGFCGGGVEVPIAILEAEHDSIAPPKLLNQFKQVLDARLELAEIIRGLNEEECEFLIEARGVKSDLELQNQFNAAMTEVEALFSQSG
ncbi:hypothetical protein VIGAN_06038400 [Vigna angularis var. angularis]|uniref:Uncharacterized protein n=1 Tax=Vigna angularis var. angularis TaxID=157739 RepID=A0A0S3S9A0_PHAAN|nr:hypothetical protein VIGAN_06038400 [Vigna angularis var. angularis]